jgi:hypothetical protein
VALTNCPAKKPIKFDSSGFSRHQRGIAKQRNALTSQILIGEAEARPPNRRASVRASATLVAGTNVRAADNRGT